jgi:hypothetical protein
MKKILFLFPVIILIAASCNSNSQPQTKPTSNTGSSMQTAVTPPATKPAATPAPTPEPSPSPTPNGLIHQLKITASAQSRSIAFTSEEDYTNCSDSLTVITVDGNQQPVFTTYKDNYGSINLFAGDQHSVAYGSLTDTAGNTLVADIQSGNFGNNTAGTWGLSCDQGQYSLVIKTIQ